MKRLNDPTNRVIVVAGVVVLLAVVLLAVVLEVPRLLYPPLPASRFAGVAPDKRVELETNRLKLQNDARATLLQGLGGVALLVGAYFTYRQVTNSRAQLHVAQQGQITERFTRAIDQLGHNQLDVRLGGIYALERIARDSPDDQPTIGEVLTAFVRSHAPWPPRLPGQYIATAPIREVQELQIRAADVQATLTVLGRGNFACPELQADRLDLHAVDLRHASLRDANLERANLEGAHLEGTRLWVANLKGADLFEAHLMEAALYGANLEEASLAGADLKMASLGGASLARANLSSADLIGADLRHVHLEGANLEATRLWSAVLSHTHLEGANLRHAHLEGADLRDAHVEGADLQWAYLDGASLERAVADEHTGWPAGFDWRAAGVILEGEDAAASPPEQA
jgi:uncharacterized protein YjbI with pentapeptide repeats